jgi:type IV pilus assembly protein PilA
MNSFKNKVLFLYLKNKTNQGFNLIKLLIVMIILGILAAISVPNFLQKIRKPKEAEAKNTVGALLRAEQAYHLKNKVFIQNINLKQPNPLGIIFSSKYYSFSIYNVTYSPQPTITGTVVFAFYQNDDPNVGLNNGIRRYKGALYYKEGNYYSAICQANQVGNTYFNPVWDNTNNEVYCDSGGTKIK